MKISMASRPAHAAIPAGPVSPEVAPIDGDPLAARRQHGVEQPAKRLQGIVLERQGGAVEQLLQIEAVLKADERRNGGIVEIRPRPLPSAPAGKGRRRSRP